MSEAKLTLTMSDEKFIEENYLNMTGEQMAKQLEVPRKKVNEAMRKKGLRKTQIPFKRFLGEKVTDLNGELEAYRVTSFGRVINKKTNTLLKHRKNNSYASVRLYIDGRPKDIRIHRLVALNFIENPDIKNKNCVNHKDGNKMNCHMSNLEWATEKENAEHASEIGLLTVGENRKNAKISEKQAWEIIKAIKSGYTNSQIVKEYPFATRSIVEKIKNKKRWKHLNW